MLLNTISAQSQPINKPKIKLNYLLHVPELYNTQPDSLFPLVIFLHGKSRRGSDLEKLKAYGPPRMIRNGYNFNFFVVSPQCPIYTSWQSINWFDTIYSEIKAKYRIDESRIYVTGMSMGGFGTWAVAMDYPEKFAAIVPLCGGCYERGDLCKLKDLPIWAFHGTADTETSVAETDRLISRLKQCNPTVKYSRMIGTGHEIQYLYETRPDIFEWMLKQRRNK